MSLTIVRVCVCWWQLPASPTVGRGLEHVVTDRCTKEAQEGQWRMERAPKAAPPADARAHTRAAMPLRRQQHPTPPSFFTPGPPTAADGPSTGSVGCIIVRVGEKRARAPVRASRHGAHATAQALPSPRRATRHRGHGTWQRAGTGGARPRTNQAHGEEMPRHGGGSDVHGLQARARCPG